MLATVITIVAIAFVRPHERLFTHITKKTRYQKNNRKRVDAPFSYLATAFLRQSRRRSRHDDVRWMDGLIAPSEGGRFESSDSEKHQELKRMDHEPIEVAEQSVSPCNLFYSFQRRCTNSKLFETHDTSSSVAEAKFVPA